jgi:hypothetical protein
MAIDDPLDQARSLVQSDERQRSPAVEWVRTAAPFIACLAEAARAWESGNIVDALKTFSSGVKAVSEAFSDSNSQYLYSLVIPEFQKLCRRFDEIEERHRTFLRMDWLSLLADADRKARATRGEERIRRIASILCNAAEAGPSQTAADAEEMMRVAMSLDDNDILVLRWLCDGLKDRFSITTGRVDHESVNSFWGQVDQHGNTRSLGEPAVPGNLSLGDLMSACAKLQAFGLVVQVGQNDMKVSPATLPYGPLRKGYDFLRYVRSAE